MKECKHNFVMITTYGDGCPNHWHQVFRCSKCHEEAWAFLYDSRKGETWEDQFYIGHEELIRASVEHDLRHCIYYPR